jgi:hypothetical protein
MKMCHRFLIMASICGLAVAAFAADDPQPKEPQPVAVAGKADPVQEGGTSAGRPVASEAIVGTADIPVSQAGLDARRLAFDAVLAEQQARIQALTDRFAAVGNSPAGVEIQKEIEREKMATNRRLLEVQLDFATRDGSEEQVNGIKAALTAMDAPQPVRQLVDRPAPTSPGR